MEEEGRRVMAGGSSGKSEVQMGKKWRDRDNRSPERKRVWTEPPRPRWDRRVPVVYYLSRNGHLEQPHFMEVALSSPHGLYLRDVIHRLALLRGTAMANMYSWSSKRSYNKSFVWHDLAENDFIYPWHGQEYVLKGSDLPLRQPAADASTQTAASPPPSDSSGRAKASSVLMQLLPCGSRDCGVRIPIPGVKLEYFSGSLIEANKEPFPTLNRSSSYNADRSSQMKMMEKEVGRAKYIPRKARGIPPRKESNSNSIINRNEEHGSKRLEFQL